MRISPPLLLALLAGPLALAAPGPKPGPLKDKVKQVNVAVFDVSGMT